VAPQCCRNAAVGAPCQQATQHTCRSAQVYNLTTYPNLVGLLDTLGVDTEPSDMSFAVSSDEGAFEWGSRGLGALFAQRRNILSPTFWRMVADVVHFGRNAPEVLNPSNAAEFGAMSTGDYLRRRRYSTVFVRHYFLPMCAAVWSVPVSQVRLSTPAVLCWMASCLHMARHMPSSCHLHIMIQRLQAGISAISRVDLGCGARQAQQPTPVLPTATVSHVQMMGAPILTL